MGKRLAKQLSIGGMYSAGDGGNNPDGTVRVLQNYLPRPNRVPSRPPVAYDSLMNINGLANLDDVTNNVTRLVAVDASHHVFTKSATAGTETWGSANATSITGDRLTAATAYRGLSLLAFADNNSAPSGLASFDGTTISTTPLGTPYSYSIAPRALSVFAERTFFSSPRIYIANNLPSLSLTKPYDWSTWTLTNCSSQVNVEGTTKTCRVTPTATTGAAAYASPSSFNYFGQAKVTWLQHLRGVSASYAMPITMQIVVVKPWSNGVAYALHDLVVDSNENSQRCSVAGTSGGSAPTWATTTGTATTDGGVTWVNDGSAVIGQLESAVPVADPSAQWTTYILTAAIPALNGATCSINYRFKFGTSETPTISLAPIDVSYRDGLTDGDKAKANFGAQVTNGDFTYPFYNVESSSSATIDLDVDLWSEVGLPTVVQAVNTYRLSSAGATGFATAAAVAANRKITFKRTAFWQFQAGSSADIPIRLERLFVGIGCVGPLAEDVFEDVIYFIGENDIYAYSPGDASPTPICGEGMREEIMNKAASSWVESQATCNRPILKIDQDQLIAWVYTQKGKLYAYDLRAKLWSRHVIGSGFGIESMAWNRNTGNFYIAFDSASHGLARMVYSSQAPDTIDNTGTTYPGEKVIVFRPIELTDPMRYDAYCEGVQILYASSGGQAVTLEISDNQGATYANSVDYTPVAVSTSGDFVPMTLDVCESGPSSTLKLTATGDLGEGAWSLSPRASVSLEIMKGEYPNTNPTSGASNL